MNHREIVSVELQKKLLGHNEDKTCNSKTVENAFILLNYLLNDANAPTRVSLCPDGNIAFDFETRGGHCSATIDDKEEIGFAYMDYSGKLVATEFRTPKEVSDKLYQIGSETFEER